MNYPYLIISEEDGRLFKENTQTLFHRVEVALCRPQERGRQCAKKGGVSKTVTKNMWADFFKNKKIKERPENPAKGGKAPQSGANILSGLSVIVFTFSLDISSQKALIMGVYLRWACKLGSGFQPNSRTGQPIRWTSQPEGLIRLTSQYDSLTPMSTFPSAKSSDPSVWVVRYLEKLTNLLIISDVCRFFVDKKFELRSKVCDMIRRDGKNPNRLIMSGWPDSNWRPLAPHASTLANCATPRSRKINQQI